MDRNDLEDWLKTRPREDAILIAQRAALRAFPRWRLASDGRSARRHDLTSLPLLRSLLASGVARKFPTPEVVVAADRAAFAAADRAAFAAAAFAAVDRAVAVADRAAALALNAAVADRAVAVVAAAAAAAAAGIWREIGADVDVLRAGDDLDVRPLWSAEMPAAVQDDELALLEIMAKEYGNRDSFWHRWYFAAKRGEWLDWDLQREVALIPEALWAAGPKAVMAAIGEIEARYRIAPLPTSALGALALAHTDFSFDVARRLMKMVPFAEDVSRLNDPETLRRLLNDSADFRATMETLVRAADTAGRQSANELKVYAQDVLAELDRVAVHGELRVGVLIDLGETLQDFSGNEDVRLGLGPTLPKSLTRAVERLLDLLRDYFAPALARLGPLRDMQLGEGAEPRALLQLAIENVRLVASNAGKVVAPLAQEDVAVLERLVDELRRSARNYEQTRDPSAKQELGQELARKAAQLGYDTALYVKRALDVVQGAMGGKDNDVADTLLRRIHLAHTAHEVLLGVWEFVRHFL